MDAMLWQGGVQLSYFASSDTICLQVKIRADQILGKVLTIAPFPYKLQVDEIHPKPLGIPVG
jgi:hypothetical protein